MKTILVGALDLFKIQIRENMANVQYVLRALVIFDVEHR